MRRSTAHLLLVGGLWLAGVSAASGVEAEREDLAGSFIAAGDQVVAGGAGSDAAVHWLEQIARSPMNDHLSGGFFERVHAGARFEKTLLTNARALAAYCVAYQATGSLLFREVTEDTAGFLVRDLRGSDGRFWRASVPATDDVGQRYVRWTADEIARFLGPERAHEFLSVYQLEEGLIALRGTPFSGLGPSRRILAFRRSRRARPDPDTTFDPAANAIAVAALARVGARLERGYAVSAARQAGQRLLEVDLSPDVSALAAAAYVELDAAGEPGWATRAAAAVDRSLRERCTVEVGEAAGETLSCRWQQRDGAELDLALLAALRRLGSRGSEAHGRQAQRLATELVERARALPELARRLAVVCGPLGCREPGAP